MDLRNITISKLSLGTEDIPYHLLLMADPSKKLVDEYLSRGETFVAEYQGTVLGIYVLIKTRPETVELVNIAVDESAQGQGLGKKLVMNAIERAKEMGAKTVEIGTANAGIDQLALYQKCGFRIVGVDHDFFLRHYNEEIYENGIQCVDMIRLSLNFQDGNYQKRGFDMKAIHFNAIQEARKIKPEIPEFGDDSIPIRHEIEFEKKLKRTAEKSGPNMLIIPEYETEVLAVHRYL